MNLLIVSDSHGETEYLQQCLSKQITVPEFLIFLGDGLHDLETLPETGTEILRVRGNCDWFCEAPEEGLTSLGGHLLFYAHGHRFGVKAGIEAILQAGVAKGADIILYGHTHQPMLETLPKGTRVGENELPRPVFLFNPGSVAQGSFGTLLLKENTVLFSHGRL